jgi:cobalt/nickel transport system permease protein
MGFGDYLEVGKMDELGRMDSPVHRLDARAKILTTVAFIVVVMSFGRYEVSALMVLFLYPFALAAAGNIPGGYLLKKVALAAPFALCVGMFNPVMDRAPMGMLGSHTIAAGWFSFASIMVRFSLTVSAGLILIACTGIHRLCEGLARLGVPRVFVVQLLFLYRYFFVIAEEGSRMLRGVEMRSVGNRRLGLATYGTLIGNLLLRSIDRSQRIYRAMVSRGFDGEVRAGRAVVRAGLPVVRAGLPVIRTGLLAGVLYHPTSSWKDVAYLGGWCLFFLLARHWNLAGEIGGHL